MLGQELPGGTHFIQEVFYILADGTLVLFICLGEDEAKWDLPLAQPIDEFEVIFLGAVAAVDKDENIHQVFAFAKIILDHFLPFFPAGQGNLGEAITGKVDDIPFVVDREMIDQLCLAGCSGRLGQVGIIAQHIDQRRLADITTTDERVLWAVRRRALGIIRAADHINAGMNDHIAE